jgi:endogenous inhibitor of DNA gyrase (YacG/DUF329 family)
MTNYDAWITSGRYSSADLDVHCPKCDEWVAVTTETEYGATEWSPAECPTCQHEFDGTEENELAEPPVNPYDDELR